MAECVVLNIGEGVTCMEGEMVRCGSCGMERQCMVSECKLCEVLARNVALEEEVKEVKVLLAQMRQQMLEVRQETSVRSRASGQRQEGDNWKVVGRGEKGRVSPPL